MAQDGAVSVGPLLDPAPGRLLVALPALTEATFARTVVYLLEADPETGSAGVVVNAPTRTPVGHVLPPWQDAMSEPGVVFRGGPVQPNGALCLAELPAPDDLVPTAGIRAGRQRVGLVDLDADATAILSAVSRLRVFAGHSGWAPGQLEAEIAERAWAVVAGTPDDVFSAEPGAVRRRVLRRAPMPLRLLSTHSPDVTLN